MIIHPSELKLGTSDGTWQTEHNDHTSYTYMTISEKVTEREKSLILHDNIGQTIYLGFFCCQYNMTAVIVNSLDLNS